MATRLVNILVYLGIFLFSINSFSESLIQKIEVKGQKKIEPDAIRNRIKSRVGDSLNQETIKSDVQSVFELGYFYDVQVEKILEEGKINLIYTVVEKPSIVEIEYKGQEKIKEDDLKEASGLKSYEILDFNKIKDGIDKIQKQYEDKGYFLAKITYRLEDVLKDETVKLIIDIQESNQVKVKKITFLGNKNIPNGKLKSVMRTQEGGFFSFLSDEDGTFKQDIFDRDVQTLNYLYFNEGYVQVKVDRPQVYVTPDKQGVFVSIRIDEGEQFDVGEVSFSGDLLFTDDELFEVTEIQHSKTFVYQTLQNDLQSLQAKYGDLGYAFANIIPRTQVREKEKLVDIVFEIDKGHKVYFGEINVKGNSKTRDKVLRRELTIREGELYNETRKRESLENIKRLGYFEEVHFNTTTPEDKPEVLNLEIQVKERNTGSIQVGAGYSTYSGLVFDARVDQANLFGRGQKLGLSINLSNKFSYYTLSFTEPYFMNSLWSVGFDVFQHRLERFDYKEDRKGGAVRFGHPLSKYLNGFVKYKYELTVLKNPSDQNPTDQDIFPFTTANGVTSSVEPTIEYDTRDDRLAPSKGLFTSANVEYAGLGGDLKFTKGGANTRFFKKIFWEVVWRNNISYGFVVGHEGRQPPFTELYVLGGAYSLRGFRSYSIGKKKYSNKSKSDVIFGGMQQIYANSEFEFPLISEAGIKGVFFFDAGQAEDKFTSPEMREDLGFGFRWFSPIGPLRFEWGFPLDRRPKEGEDTVNFEFSIGSPF